MIRTHIYTPELLLRCYTIKITIITAQCTPRIASRALINYLMIFPFSRVNVNVSWVRAVVLQTDPDLNSNVAFLSVSH